MCITNWTRPGGLPNKQSLRALDIHLRRRSTNLWLASVGDESVGVLVHLLCGHGQYATACVQPDYDDSDDKTPGGGE